MKLTKFDVGSLYNEEWSAYQAFLLQAIGQVGADALSLTALLPLLEANAALAGQAMEFIRKSEYTRLCDEADAKRDRLIAAVNSTVRSFLYEDDMSLRDAANSLMLVVEHYSGMANENRDQETARITNFLAELRERHAEQIARLDGLTRRLDQLQAANAEYARLQTDRTFANAAAEQTAVRMTDVRREGNRLISATWDLTNVLLLSAATPAVERFAALLNEENGRVRARLTARRGRKEEGKK
ncbi:MAG: DUF6261 family protein [Prevotellaceae bacterium]|nr:DUF6261 family protein [Prevotellaceae bacterium]